MLRWGKAQIWGKKGTMSSLKLSGVLMGHSAPRRCRSGILGREWVQDIEIWESGPL